MRPYREIHRGRPVWVVKLPQYGTTVSAYNRRDAIMAATRRVRLYEIITPAARALFIMANSAHATPMSVGEAIGRVGRAITEAESEARP